MASYTSNLKTWGSSGTKYPDGYNYIEGEQPVDEWDNFLTSEIISDIKDHLVPLTNSRVETDYGGAGGEPGSPETSHVYHDQDNERLELWDTDKGAWRDIMFRDGDTMDGALDMGNYPISGVTSFEADSQVTLNPGTGNLTDGGSVDSNAEVFRGYYDSDGSTSVTATNVDATLQHVANEYGSSVLDARVQGTDILRVHSTGEVTVPSGDIVDGAGHTVYDQSNNWVPQSRLENDKVTVAGNLVSLGSSTNIELGDLSNVTASGEGSGNGFDADTVDGKHASDLNKSPVSENGAQVLSSPEDINFSNGITVSDDGDNTVTIDADEVNRAHGYVMGNI
jgi:hypothetical protein